jgi:hypothetical protein
MRWDDSANRQQFLPPSLLLGSSRLLYFLAFHLKIGVKQLASRANYKLFTLMIKTPCNWEKGWPWHALKPDMRKSGI